MASSSFDQLSYPGLRVDEGVAPFLAVDDWSLGALSAALAGGFDGGLHLGKEGFGFWLCGYDGGDEADVFVDVGEGVRGEGYDWQAGLEDRGEGFHAVGDAGYDEIGLGMADFFGVGGPTVMDDLEVASGQVGEGFEAVFCAGGEGVEAVEGGESEGD